ncbi:ATP-binding protein, partial [Carbonactinospora thermoautotrophica]|uniref:ATP-binding protein n=1 Tax=Carbonactinospora thermoautotrophica TaxID=1469144 RepID=UPI002FCD4561
MNPITRRVVIDDVSAVHEARRAAAQLAADLGFCEVRREQVAIAASELASNAHKHTRGGDVYLQPAPHLPGPVLEMIAADHGPGVAAFEQCLVDGYSTTGTLGAGLGAVQRLASYCAAYSCPERGTVVLARFTAQLDPPMSDPTGPAAGRRRARPPRPGRDHQRGRVHDRRGPGRCHRGRGRRPGPRPGRGRGGANGDRLVVRTHRAHP